MDRTIEAARMGLTITGGDADNAASIAAALGISKGAAVRWALGVAAVVCQDADAARCRKGEDAAAVFGTRGPAAAPTMAPK